MLTNLSLNERKVSLISTSSSSIRHRNATCLELKFEKVECKRKLGYDYWYLGLLYTLNGDKASALEQYKAIKRLGSYGGLFDSLAEELFNTIHK